MPIPDERAPPGDESFDRFLLTLRDVGDPSVRNGYPARDAAGRARLMLKMILRSYGFRCEAITNPPTPPPPASVPSRSS